MARCANFETVSRKMALECHRLIADAEKDRSEAQREIDELLADQAAYDAGRRGFWYDEGHEKPDVPLAYARRRLAAANRVIAEQRAVLERLRKDFPEL